jgi:hypothetical protein
MHAEKLLNIMGNVFFQLTVIVNGDLILQCTCFVLSLGRPQARLILQVTNSLLSRVCYTDKMRNFWGELPFNGSKNAGIWRPCSKAAQE